MTTIKSFTSLEQSKRLAEILSIESADMYWFVPADNEGEFIEKVELIRYKSDYNMFDKVTDWDDTPYVPCWSLSALLRLMPKLYEFENNPEDGGCQPKLCKGWDNNQWHIVYRSSIYITEWYDDPIDAAFEMVCWLKENEKL